MPRNSGHISSGSRRDEGKVIAEIDLAVVHPAQLVDGHLRPVVEDLHHALDPHEVVAIEGIDHFRHVVPHLGVQFAGAVGQTAAKDTTRRFSFWRISLEWTRKLVVIS